MRGRCSRSSTRTSEVILTTQPPVRRVTVDDNSLKDRGCYVAYDTLTAFTSPEGFVPDLQLGWTMHSIRKGVDPETGELLGKDWWSWNKDGYDFTYHSNNLLLLQISLPRQIYGSNVEPWEPDQDYADQLGEVNRQVTYRLMQSCRLGSGTSWRTWESWKPFRVDATANYHLGNQTQVMAVSRALMDRRIPGFQARPYTTENLGVRWIGQTRRHQVYSKYLEQADLGHIEEARRAEGILRAESAVIRSHAVRRVLQKPLKLQRGEKLTVARITSPAAVSEASKAILGKLPDVIAGTLGALTMVGDITLEDLVKDLGPSEAAKVIGIHLLWSLRGEEWVRQAYGSANRANFHRTMKKLKDLGVDPRTVDLGLGKQLQLL